MCNGPSIIAPYFTTFASVLTWCFDIIFQNKRSVPDNHCFSFSDCRSDTLRNQWAGNINPGDRMADHWKSTGVRQINVY